MISEQQPGTPSLAHGRLCIVSAALLWSTSGAFTKVLTVPTFVGAHEPPIESVALAGTQYPVQIAFYRALFAGLALLPMVRRKNLSIRPLMVLMVLCFAAMNLTFISAQALGKAANAILLQYTAPLWMYLAVVFWGGERPERRGTISLALGMLGIAVILAGGWQEGDLLVILIALTSGLTYAAVLLCLRALRKESSSWLTVWNHLLSALILVPLMIDLQPPTGLQYLVLVLFGACQMGLAYWLMARGLRVVPPQEAGTLTLLEPLLNPVWAFLVAGEVPHGFTFVGGAIILAGLAWRYWPEKKLQIEN